MTARKKTMIMILAALGVGACSGTPTAVVGANGKLDAVEDSKVLLFYTTTPYGKDNPLPPDLFSVPAGLQAVSFACTEAVSIISAEGTFKPCTSKYSTRGCTPIPYACMVLFEAIECRKCCQDALSEEKCKAKGCACHLIPWGDSAAKSSTSTSGSSRIR